MGRKVRGAGARQARLPIERHQPSSSAGQADLPVLVFSYQPGPDSRHPAACGAGLIAASTDFISISSSLMCAVRMPLLPIRDRAAGHRLPHSPTFPSSPRDSHFSTPNGGAFQDCSTSPATRGPVFWFGAGVVE